MAAASGDTLGNSEQLTAGAVIPSLLQFLYCWAENLNRSRITGGIGNVASYQMAEHYLTLMCRWELRKNPFKWTCFHISTHFDMP